MNAELILRALFKLMGVGEAQMREVFDKGQSLIVDGKTKIDNIDARLARIERALSINPTHLELVKNDDAEDNKQA